uniref:uncharacterized protein LOC113474634 n=1 Tax=Ciona intestinalis TaxID=7719 RepID=UPI000EF4D7EF|nr:uncharacterized protein LOC113474634 [Ciona intestinalis]|eukprot:XP_026692268.1 uncharacterized protein LOC113474634 [Ciona intestinalis]
MKCIWFLLLVEVMSAVDSCNGMGYQDIILWFPDVADRRKINKNTALKYCNDNGGRLVDIVDKAMYNVVYNYCRRTIVFGSHVHYRIWLGLSYSPVTDTVTQSNRKPGYHGDWYPGLPNSGSGYKMHTGLLLVIQTPSSTLPFHGMHNYSPTLDITVTQLCSTKIM